SRWKYAPMRASKPTSPWVARAASADAAAAGRQAAALESAATSSRDCQRSSPRTAGRAWSHPGCDNTESSRPSPEKPSRASALSTTQRLAARPRRAWKVVAKQLASEEVAARVRQALPGVAASLRHEIAQALSVGSAAKPATAPEAVL